SRAEADLSLKSLVLSRCLSIQSGPLTMLIGSFLPRVLGREAMDPRFRQALWPLATSSVGSSLLRAAPGLRKASPSGIASCSRRMRGLITRDLTGGLAVRACFATSV